MATNLTENKNYIFEPEQIRVDTSFATGLSIIDDLNLDRIVVKAMDAVSGYGWTQEYAVDVSKLYRIFLFLCATYPDEIIVPPYEVDQLWHLHILDTRNYHEDCHRLFGSYLHHFPYAGLPGTGASHAEEEKFKERTLELVVKHFPQVLGD